MFIDASALTAILIDEPDAGDLRVRLAARVPRSTSPMAVWETVLAVSRRRVMEIEDAEGVVEDPRLGATTQSPPATSEVSNPQAQSSRFTPQRSAFLAPTPPSALRAA